MMAHPHTSLILLLLCCSLSAGKTFYTHLGTRCTEDCKPNGGEYKCKTTDQDGKCQEMYCSPKKNMDYLGRQCNADSLCEKHGQDYHWCYTGTLSWGYCGLVMEVKDHYGSYYGALCYDYCDKREQDYYWCHTAEGWDYCSPSENTDYKNKQCKENSQCTKEGQKYNWCYLTGGSWGYCGLVKPKMFLHRSKKHYVCIDECQYYESGDYYWCHTGEDWDYCSPAVNVTYKGMPCRSDHSCGSYGSNYNWCWTPDSKYDYCGPIESGECTYISSTHRNKRAPDKKIVICRVKDKTSNTEITFTSVEAPGAIANGKKWNNDFENIISRWSNNYLVRQARSNLVVSGNLRIDMQGSFTRNNVLYYNLQIQVNVGRRAGQSTTISQIIVPDGVSEEYIRRAFQESFLRQARILVNVSTLNQC